MENPGLWLLVSLAAVFAGAVISWLSQATNQSGGGVVVFGLLQFVITNIVGYTLLLMALHLSASSRPAQAVCLTFAATQVHDQGFKVGSGRCLTSPACVQVGRCCPMLDVGPWAGQARAT